SKTTRQALLRCDTLIDLHQANDSLPSSSKFGNLTSPSRKPTKSSSTKSSPSKTSQLSPALSSSPSSSSSFASSASGSGSAVKQYLLHCKTMLDINDQNIMDSFLCVSVD